MSDITRRLLLVVLIVFVWSAFIMCGAYHAIKMIESVESAIKQDQEQIIEW